MYIYTYIDMDIYEFEWDERKNKIRIFGAGYWREGKEIYEKNNKR
ncbi:MAG: hypothetical protein OEZ22_08075 [Spirochaetia bacterium]|nr:hypothetical protein [Spirochaetia bacterium]